MRGCGTGNAVCTIMSIKKIIAISILSLFVIFLAVIIFIPPNVTEITDAKLFYNVESVNYGNFSDDTSFEEISDRSINVKFDLTVTKRFFWVYLEGSITIGNKQYFPHLYNNNRSSVIITSLGGRSGGVDASLIYISNDLSHFMLFISEDNDGETAGSWLNCTNLADYKDAMVSLFPNEPFGWKYDDNGQ